MKYLPVVALILVFHSFSYSQVKKQIKGNIFNQTTIVIKEKGADDLDILDTEFDLDEIGMDQVIRIETDQVWPEPAKEKSRLENGATVEGGPADSEAELLAQATPLQTDFRVPPEDLQKVIVFPHHREKTEQPYTHSGNYRVFKKYPYKNRRFKKKKRKRFSKMLRGSCFRF